MERGTWTNERLDDLALGMREGFARVDVDVRDLRVEMRDMRVELTAEIAALRLMIMRFGGGMLVALIGVIAAILLRGA
jgi:hypothetical protein